MKESLNQNTLFNTLAMARQSSSCLILVVEGQDDFFLLRSHRNEDDLILIPGLGRPYTLAAAELASSRGLTGVRFLVDADLDRIVSNPSSFPGNVLTSASHDVMMDLVLAENSPILKVVAAHCRGVERTGADVEPEQIVHSALELAACVAGPRVANHQHSLELNFSNFPFGGFDTCSPTLSEVATMVVLRSKADLTVELLMEKVESGPSLAGRTAEVVGDHDFFRALARVMSEVGVKVKPDTLFTSFLAAVSCFHLLAAGWFQELLEWGSRNSRTPFGCPCAA